PFGAANQPESGGLVARQHGQVARATLIFTESFRPSGEKVPGGRLDSEPRTLANLRSQSLAFAYFAWSAV
ncbi:MAG: hypothetical protein DME18_12685, partial [Verrucomicrobia bacterium]